MGQESSTARVWDRQNKVDLFQDVIQCPAPHHLLIDRPIGLESAASTLPSVHSCQPLLDSINLRGTPGVNVPLSVCASSSQASVSSFLLLLSNIIGISTSSILV